MENIYYLLKFKKKEIPINYLKKFKPIPAIIDGKCQRCGSLSKDECLECSEFGKLTSKDSLYVVNNKKEMERFKYEGNLNNLKLTKLQQKASNFMIEKIKENKDGLIWAVCGAGKTEITFRAIEYVLIKKGLVCFAIPRIDILYEIKERLEMFFPDTKIALLCGQKKEMIDAQIFVITTNQMLKFNEAFDLIIIDEVDAFPFEVEPKFMRAVELARTKASSVFYLTSTPSEAILEKNNECFIINRRWHNYDLPVPKIRYLDINKIKKRKSLTLMWRFLMKKRQILIFVANIKKCKELARYINKNYPNQKVDCVYSSDINRKEKIEKFRNNKIEVLITTPILERGVTFKDIDCIVLDADNDLYNVASLVQIAGRVGRNPQFQRGKVYFYCKKINKTIKEAKKQIENMNKK